MTGILGEASEIKITWRCKPELRTRMVRYMMKHHGYAGVKALADVLNMTYRQLYEIGGLEGWLKKRNRQRRQKSGRQNKKLKNLQMEVEYENSSDMSSNGGGKRGKEGGLQDTGRRVIMASVKGQ